jgi:hypothetical protein
MSRSGSARSIIDHFPDFIAELQVFDILGDVVQPSDQHKGIAHCEQSGNAQVGGYSQPGLIPNLHSYAILDGLQDYAQSRLTPRHWPSGGADLNRNFLAAAHLLHLQIPAIEMGHQAASQIVWRDVAVVCALLHGMDYNLEP